MKDMDKNPKLHARDALQGQWACTKMGSLVLQIDTDAQVNSIFLLPKIAPPLNRIHHPCIPLTMIIDVYTYHYLISTTQIVGHFSSIFYTMSATINFY